MNISMGGTLGRYTCTGTREALQVSFLNGLVLFIVFWLVRSCLPVPKVTSLQGCSVIVTFFNNAFQ